MQEHDGEDHNDRQAGTCSMAAHTTGRRATGGMLCGQMLHRKPQQFAFEPFKCTVSEKTNLCTLWL